MTLVRGDRAHRTVPAGITRRFLVYCAGRNAVPAERRTNAMQHSSDATTAGGDAAAARREDERAGLSERDMDRDPIRQFARWMDAATDAGLPEPTAATLATADAAGHPSGRVVLIKGYDADGFTFFTNYLSRKGRDLAANPRAALVCFWPELERQVVIMGTVAPVSAAEADAYFRTRPRGSQIGAWASEQSAVIAGREVLERRVAEFGRRFDGQDVPRPPHWGGYRLAPEAIVFWQGRPDRLHDRLRYRRGSDGRWVIERLAP